MENSVVLFGLVGLLLIKVSNYITQSNTKSIHTQSEREREREERDLAVVMRKVSNFCFV